MISFLITTLLHQSHNSEKLTHLDSQMFSIFLNPGLTTHNQTHPLCRRIAHDWDSDVVPARTRLLPGTRGSASAVWKPERRGEVPRGSFVKTYPTSCIVQCKFIQNFNETKIQLKKNEK